MHPTCLILDLQKEEKRFFTFSMLQENEKNPRTKRIHSASPQLSGQTFMVYGLHIVYCPLCARTAQMDAFVTTPPFFWQEFLPP